MISKDRFTLLDVYDTTTEFKILTGKQVSLYVFNQACAYQILKPVSGPGRQARGFEIQAEEQVSPGTIVFPGANGIKLRNVITGGGSPPGLCSIRVYDQADIIGVGYTPITQTISAAGTLGQLGVLDHNPNLIDNASSLAEQSFYTFSVPGNTLGASGLLRATVIGDYLYNDNVADTLTLRLKFGGQTLFAQAQTGVLGAQRVPWVLRVLVANVGVTNAQTLTADLISSTPASTAPTSGIGRFGISDTQLPSGGAMGLAASSFGTVDTTLAQTLDLTAQWSVSSANNSFRKRYAVLESV